MKKGEKIQLVGLVLSKFLKDPQEREEILDSETMKISACKAPKFKAGKALKDAVNA